MKVLRNIKIGTKIYGLVAVLICLMAMVAGFGIVLFTFAGVPWLVRTVRLESLHGF